MPALLFKNDTKIEDIEMTKFVIEYATDSGITETLMDREDVMIVLDGDEYGAVEASEISGAISKSRILFAAGDTLKLADAEYYLS